MDHQFSAKKLRWLLCLGMLGCILMGGSDWLMIYGNTAYEGRLAWLTVGVAGIAPERNCLAMALAFPAVVCYGLALMAVAGVLGQEKHRRRYLALTTLGMTPWLCLHLFYIMILFAFGWMNRNGMEAQAFPLCEAVFDQFAWTVIAGEVLMVLPFLYLAVAMARGRTMYARAMAINNPLVLYIVLKGITLLLPDTAFRLAFTNGLMSEAMILWFLILILGIPKRA